MQHTLRTYNVMMVKLGDPNLIRVHIDDYGLTSPAAKEKMMSCLRGKNGVAEIADLTLQEDGIIFELTDVTTTEDEVKEVCRRAMLVLCSTFDNASFEEYCSYHGEGFNAMAVSSVYDH